MPCAFFCWNSNIHLKYYSFCPIKPIFPQNSLLSQFFPKCCWILTTFSPHSTGISLLLAKRQILQGKEKYFHGLKHLYLKKIFNMSFTTTKGISSLELSLTQCPKEIDFNMEKPFYLPSHQLYRQWESPFLFLHPIWGQFYLRSTNKL